MPANIDEYNEVRSCEYKGRKYLVRDNGAVCRISKEESKPTQYDDVWTFGKKNSDGYMIFTGNVRVHQIVCTAFHGPEPKPNMVVDHIDTNRCNNRPENLRWFTRLENALNNEATRKKIIYYCGSVDAFIEDPSILRTKVLPKDISWMRTVTKEEAAACKQHVDEWSKRDNDNKQKSDKGIEEWIYNPPYKSWRQQQAEAEEMARKHEEEILGLRDSLTPGAKQWQYRILSEFPLCPGLDQERTLQAYLDRLVKGEIFLRNAKGNTSAIIEAGYNPNKDALYVLLTLDTINSCMLCKVFMQDGFFVHKSIGAFMKLSGGEKYFTLAMDREWTGGPVFDDYC